MSETFNYREEYERQMSQAPRRLIRAEQLHDPIPETLDESFYGGIFRSSKDEPYFLPYAGSAWNSTHSYLDMLIKLARLSVTHGSCISSQDFICFGGPMSIVGDQRKYVFQESREIGQGEKQAYIDMLSQYVPTLDPVKVMSEAFQWRKKTGDRYYLLEGNEDFATVKVVDPRKALYYIDPDIEYEVIGVSEKRFTYQVKKDKDYILVPKYPVVGEYSGEKTWRTILHFKDGQNPVYGRPDTEQALITIFREYMDDNHLLKSSANHFTGRGFLEFEDAPIPTNTTQDEDAQQAGHFDFADEIEMNLTNKAEDPMGLMVWSRPYGSTAFSFSELSNNTHEGFYNFLDTSAFQKIVMAHKWSPRLLGVEDATGLSTNVFMDALKIKRIGVIRKYQSDASLELKKCLDAIGEILGFQNDVRFMATTPFDELNEEIQAAESQAQTTGGSSGGGLKERIEAYSIGVRAGAIMPQEQDENAFRGELGVPAYGEEVRQAWADDDGVRRPVTLKSKTEKDAEIAKTTGREPEQTDDDDVND